MQSALSQQVQRLERELGVLLLKRSPHHVSLTAAGAAFLAEARQILAHPARAAAIASRAAGASGHCGPASSTPAATRCRRSCTRCGPATPAWSCTKSRPACPSSTGSSPTAARTSASTWPARPRPRSPRTCSARTRWGFLVPSGHRFAELDSIPVTVLADEPLLLAEEVRPRNSTSSPSRCAGLLALSPPCTRGPWKASAAADLVAQGRCLYCVPSSCISALRRDHLAAAHRTSLLLPVVSAVARHRHLRPRAGHRQLRTTISRTRLARRPKAAGALTGPDTVRPVATPLRRAVTTVRSESKYLLPMVSKAQALYSRRFR